jgi:hypothetical protein
MRKILFCLFLLAAYLFCLGGITDVCADTHTATSCTQTAIQAAIDAASDGDTVIVPAGSCSFSTTLSKAITLQGAGIGNTIFTGGGISCDTDGFRITGFSFEGTSGAYGRIQLSGKCSEYNNWRIDHCRFSLTYRAIRANGQGVIDHCIFEQSGGATMIGGVLVHGGCETSWQRPAGIGTADAVYIEDCTFDWSINENDSVVDGGFGGRVVFRYNTVIGTEFQVHGLCTCDKPPDGRGNVKSEVYNNVFDAGDGSSCRNGAICIRGGTGVIFNNTITGNWCGSTLLMKHYRACDSRCGSWGLCNGSNPLDGNLLSNGYPCLDQIGRAPDTNEDGIQESEPIYEWNNTDNGSDVDLKKAHCSTDHVLEGRDYYNDTQRPGYTPYPYPHPLVTGEEPPPPPPPPSPDTTPPADVTLVNDGTSVSADIDSTSLTTELSASWTPSTDGESDISKYWYAIGTTAGGTDTAEWTSTSNGTVTSVTRSNLLLTTGVKYYFTVKAENGAGLESNPTSSDGQFVVGGGTAHGPGEDEIDAKVYPNPLVLGGQMTFSVSDTTGGEVKIYTISGKLVKKLEIQSGVSGVNWDVLNEEGNSIKAGLYIYTITDAVGNKKTGKLAISK